MSSPIICFGQQPCGFFPKRFLASKIFTARRLRDQIGGQIVFFYHDADHDPRETRTDLTHRQSGKVLSYNFEFENKLQRKYSPLYLKRVPEPWRRQMLNALPNYLGAEADRLLDAFSRAPLASVADFCLSIYRDMGLLDGITVMRSGDKTFRRAACDIDEFFVDVPYNGETVRARWMDNALKLHEGGPSYLTLPAELANGGNFAKEQLSPTRDSRLKWMQSVIRCTHYIAGMGEQGYLKKDHAPDITYVERDPIERSDEAYTA